MLQYEWRASIVWDDPFNESLNAKLSQWTSSLPVISNVEVPCIGQYIYCSGLIICASIVSPPFIYCSIIIWLSMKIVMWLTVIWWMIEFQHPNLWNAAYWSANLLRYILDILFSVQRFRCVFKIFLKFHLLRATLHTLCQVYSQAFSHHSCYVS